VRLSANTFLEEKEINWDSDTWYDYNEGCGDPEDHVDNPEYARGFHWQCCKHEGYSEGCKVTRHRLKVNVPLKIASLPASKKRKPEAEAERPAARARIF